MPGANQVGPHPAFARFQFCADASARLLVIHAAGGTGRSWFARSWIRERQGEVHDWSGSGLETVAQLEFLAQRLGSETNLHFAVIVAPSVQIWTLASIVAFQLAEQRDLFLDETEIGQMHSTGLEPGVFRAQSIHALCGGWLGAARILSQDPDTHARAQHVIRHGLGSWLRHRDPRGEISESAFLNWFDTQTVEAFYGEIAAAGPGLGELSGAGAIHSDGRGGWMMPVMVRQVLLERAEQRGEVRTTALEHAALNAVATTRGVGNAVESAVEGRRWPALMNLLLDQWADMFVSNPLHLGAIAAKIPRFITGQTGYMRVGLRILSAAGKDGMVLHLPALKPEYSTDRTAQRLRADTERLYRKPPARSLTIGLLEISHLRLTGLYEDAGEAALRLREALHRAQDSEAPNPSLVAIVEIHSGLTLHLAGRESEARSAYEAGYHMEQISGKAFLLADVAGKLALLHALQDDGAIARQWLDEHESVIDKVGWGRKMVARTTVMTRVYLSMCDLDVEAAASELGTLPPSPDSDELWSVHAYLLALSHLRRGLPAAARLLFEALRRERTSASAGPLAAGLFDEALLLVSIFEGGATSLGFRPGQTDPVLTALRHLQMGQHDAALSVLTHKPRCTGARRWGRLSLYLDVAARNPDGPTPEAVARLQLLFSGSTDLAKISYLRMIPGWAPVTADLEVGPEDRLRLATSVFSSAASHAGRPLLTPREYEILRQLRAGLTRRQIAESGFRSENTVKTQIRGLYRKLEAKDVVQALGNARNWGL